MQATEANLDTENARHVRSKFNAMPHSHAVQKRIDADVHEIKEDLLAQ